MKKRKHDDASLSCSLIRRPIQRWGWLFLLPTFAAFCVGFLYPFAKGLFLSFCKFKTTSKWTWVGLKNYQTIFQDDGFLHAFWYTALFALVSLLIINVLAFAVAYVLTKGIKGSNIFRTVFFMPNLIGGIVLGYIVSAIANQVLPMFTDGMDVTVSPSFNSIAAAFGISVFIGVLFGYLPANKAAKLNPIDALRYD